MLYLHKNADTQNYVSGVTDKLVWLDDVTADLSKYVKTETMTAALAGKLNTTDVKDWAKAASKPTYTADEVKAIPVTAKGAASGVAELDSAGKLPSNRYDFATSAEVTAVVTEVLGS